MMTFSKNQTEFPSAIHAAIWNAARRVFPLDGSFADAGTPDAGCADLHRCTMDAFADMYAHPEAYGLDPAEAAAHLAHRPWSKAIILADIKNDKPRMKFFSQAGQRVSFFQFFCRQLKNEGNASNAGNIVINGQSADISKDGYKYLLKQFKNYLGFGEGEILGTLKRLSFEIAPHGNGYKLTNAEYPSLFGALAELHTIEKAQKTSHKNAVSSACHFLDFRALRPGYECSFGDALYSLDDENKSHVIRLDGFLTSLGIKKKCRLNTVEWSYKGKIIVTYNGLKSHLDIRKSGNANNLIVVSFGRWHDRPWDNPPVEYATENRLAFEQAVSNAPNANEIEAFCKKTIRRCSECSCRQWGPPPHGCPKKLFDKVVRTCAGGTNFGVENLSESNFGIICDLIKVRLEAKQK